MADPAEAGARNAGNPDDEEERPDLGRIETQLGAAGGEGELVLVFDSKPGAMVIRNARTGLDVFWFAPDMEGHPDAIALGELIAEAPEHLRQLVREARRLQELAGIVE